MIYIIYEHNNGVNNYIVFTFCQVYLLPDFYQSLLILWVNVQTDKGPLQS